MRSKRYKLALLAVKIIDAMLDSEYDVDDNKHCKKCCEICKKEDSKFSAEEGIDTVSVK